MILFALFIFILLSSSISQTSAESKNTVYNEFTSIRLVIHVQDINQRQKLATVDIHVFIDNFPENLTEVQVWITGGGSIMIGCQRTGTGASGWHYQGESNSTVWLLEGTGETFPFDSYNLRFIVYNMPLVQDSVSLSTDGNQAAFDGPNAYSLKDLWQVEKGLIPIGDLKAKEISFLVQRGFNALLTATLQFLVPIIACYYLLGATLILDPKKQLAERLRIYISLFVFVPAFFIAIQQFLPYRSSLSFPEFFLINLIISTSIFGIFSIVGSQKVQLPFVVRLYEQNGYQTKWDLPAITLSLMFSALIYLFTLFGKMTVATSLIFTYVIVPSYLYWHFILISKEQLMKRKFFYACFIAAFLIPFFVLAFLWLLLPR